MHAYYISTLLQVLDSLGVSREQLMRGTGVADQEPLTAMSLTAQQLDTACTKALTLSQDPE